MRSTDRRRRATILAGSLLLHVAVLAWLALPQPPLLQHVIPDELPIVTVDLLRPERAVEPKPRAAPASAAAPSPVLPFQVRQPARPVPVGVPTLTVPAAGVARPGTAIRPAPLPGEGAGDLRTALRGSATGCVSADAVGLNRRERETCDERFGAAKAKGEPLSGMDAARRQALDAQAAAQEAYRRYQDAPMAPGVDHRSREHPGTMKEIPFVLGAEQDGLGRPRKSVVDQIRREKDSADRARKFLELQKKAGQQ
ncbi:MULTISPECIES: hypothetical protein [unclassified Caulobacter]|uniref:hypothetical protein n=1 Tax=unclassified Caulobacter TaxID=2648921 RepID=UPI0006F6DDBC|nr:MULTISPECIES: hypothetical protein [unclassified Caulobacter]KQV62905.1 hypothetical protein ASC62_04795 [Caulobacter sp. Root342]KQV72005.1 hypothetical protein ASC70_24070 [Caulobacter sp. Root343]